MDGARRMGDSTGAKLTWLTWPAALG